MLDFFKNNMRKKRHLCGIVASLVKHENRNNKLSESKTHGALGAVLT